MPSPARRRSKGTGGAKRALYARWFGSKDEDDFAQISTGRSDIPSWLCRDRPAKRCPILRILGLMRRQGAMVLLYPICSLGLWLIKGLVAIVRTSKFPQFPQWGFSCAVSLLQVELKFQ